LAAALIVVLRVVIGWHFFKEGASKTHDSSFSSSGFLASAKGPAAPFFHSMLRDPDGVTRLGLTEGEGGLPTLDLAPTLSAWEEHRQAVSEHYGFGDPDLVKRLEESRSHMLQKNSDGGMSIDEKIKRVKSQPADAARILAKKTAELEWFVNANKVDIEEYSRGLGRREFNADDASRANVESLRGQSEKVAADLQKKRAPWLAQIDNLWKDYDRQLAALAIPEQRERGAYRPALAGDRGFDVDLIDRVIPYFDLAVGACLILGLFTRLASTAGALFLATVVISQWPGAIGAAPVYYQAIEMCALLVLAAVGAGRYAGLDAIFYLFRARRRQARLESNSSSRDSSSRPAATGRTAQPVAIGR
jgi:uncharacterized membrane protein YphA (DoxX/SURF4 family)